jgi:hypothetical protein
VEASAASSTDASAGSVLGTPDASCQLDGEADLADQVGGGRRQPLGHTSPSAASRSPSYTPAPPEALIDASEWCGLLALRFERPQVAGQGVRRSLGPEQGVVSCGAWVVTA